MRPFRDFLLVAVAFVLVSAFWLVAIVPAKPQVPSTPGTPQACSGAVTVLLNGSPLPSPFAGCVLNIKSGPGIMATPASDPAIGGTDISFSLNTAFAPSFVQLQANPLYCASSNGTPQYTCSLSGNGPALANYSKGLELLFLPDVTCATSCTLAVDSATLNGAGSTTRAILENDGVSQPNGTLIGGQAHRIWFDGNVFRME